MKKSFFPLIIIAVLSVISAFSEPIYYTFTGTISFLPQDMGGYAATHNIRVGNTVTYIFAVDTAQMGFTKYQGAKTNKPDSLNEGTGYRADYFFDSLITPSLFSAAVTDNNSGSYFGYHISSKLGTLIRNSAALQTIIGDGNRYTQIIVSIPNSTSAVFLPVVGTSFSVTEAYANGSTAASSASMTMTLTAISNTKPSVGIHSQHTVSSQAWMQANLAGDFLVLQNRSGYKAQAKIFDVSGKTSISLTLNGKTYIPVSTLPHGLFFLKAATEKLNKTML